jgi:hypothetical protein
VTHEDAGFCVVGRLDSESDVASKAYAELTRAPSLKDCRGHRPGSVVFSSKIIKYLEPLAKLLETGAGDEAI